MIEYPDIIKKKWLIAKNYIRLEYTDGFYSRKNYSYDKHIEALETLFNDHGSGVSWIQRHLLDPDSRGIYGELTHVSKRGQTVVLEPTLTDDPEELDEYTVEIDRDVLLRLTNEWQALVRKKAPEIFIVRKDDEFLVTDKLPEGIELASFVNDESVKNKDVK